MWLEIWYTEKAHYKRLGSPSHPSSLYRTNHQHIVSLVFVSTGKKRQVWFNKHQSSDYCKKKLRSVYYYNGIHTVCRKNSIGQKLLRRSKTSTERIIIVVSFKRVSRSWWERTDGEPTAASPAPFQPVHFSDRSINQFLSTQLITPSAVALPRRLHG